MASSLLDRVVVLGTTGQVGRALLKRLGPKAKGLSRSDFDFEARPLSLKKLESLQPTLVINATAFTQVDLAEKEIEQNDRVNHTAVTELGAWSAKTRIPLVHFSTDYVFPGTGTMPWRETDATDPQNAYGRAKLAGETELLNSGAQILIFRTSWVYDAEGKNFFRTILRLSAERPELRIVGDQFGAPTYAPHLANLVIDALSGCGPKFPESGIFHLAGLGETTWHGFARAIVAGAKSKGLPIVTHSLISIPSEEFPMPAKRPKNSRLDQTKFLTTFGRQMPDWEVGLVECLDEFVRNPSTLARIPA